MELLIPDLEVLPEDGAQQRVWDSSRAFLVALKAEVSCEVRGQMGTGPEP